MCVYIRYANRSLKGGAYGFNADLFKAANLLCFALNNNNNPF